jgi:hypothetical protein
MKNILTVLSVSCAVLFGACESEGVEKPVAASTYEEKLDTITPYLRADLELSAERPRPDVMSEQEIAVRAFTYLWNHGMLSSSYLLQEDPRLSAAKVQKPILCYNLSEDYGETFYLLTANLENGETLIHVSAYPDVNLPESEFKMGNPAMGGPSYHIMTEQEAVDYIEYRFPGQSYEGPIAVRIKLAGNPYSTASPFWYFTSGGAEYIIDAYVSGAHGFNKIPGGVTNYEAIDTPGMAGSPALYGRRMARIDSPAANFFEKIKAASSTYAIPNSPKPVFEFTPLE